jgi:hypothetical protein
MRAKFFGALPRANPAPNPAHKGRENGSSWQEAPRRNLRGRGGGFICVHPLRADEDGGRMFESDAAAGSERLLASRAGRWLAAALALAVLVGCEHGSPAFDRSTGQFRVPLGAGSSGQGTHR